MDFLEALNSLSAKVRQQAASIRTEEATKTALVMPFIHTVLGYDVFDPSEVVPEYTCDVGTKKGEKIDYAIVKEGNIQILIETKKNRRAAEHQSCQPAVPLFPCDNCKDFDPHQWPSLQVFYRPGRA
ncbi:HSDR-domain protein [Pseudomonas syringae pv. actinidiae]|uniref:HSDR-domain protein n=1 Tax=Pseudomonas syringae pv. actinidiae TaxID=103796 RepID=A0A7Z6U823_PSESF|nr:HSDR-domain protein [Pseudomonas syringae pv. actinidiae]